MKVTHRRIARLGGLATARNRRARLAALAQVQGINGPVNMQGQPAPAGAKFSQSPKVKPPTVKWGHPPRNRNEREGH